MRQIYAYFIDKTHTLNLHVGYERDDYNFLRCDGCVEVLFKSTRSRNAVCLLELPVMLILLILALRIDKGQTRTSAQEEDVLH